MPAGLQVFDGSQNIFWDTAMFIGRTLGYSDIGTGSGQIVNNGFTQGIPWAIPVLNGASLGQSDGAYININLWLSAPNIWFSGNTLSWTRSGAYPEGWAFPSCRIYYGVR